MLPFARIFRYGDIGKEVVLDIDFSTQSVGDTSIIDRTGHSIFSLQSGTTSGVVEYNEVLGSNVMRFNNTKYICPMNAYLTLPGHSFEIQLVLNNNSAPVGEIFCTGDYNVGRIPGMNMSNNPSAGVYQMFMDSGSTYRTIQFGTVVNTGWDIVSFKVDSTGITTTVNGLVQRHTLSPFGAGTNFSIGGSYTGGTPAYWNGLLKSIKIIRI
ncbi:virion structural protein [Cronobacter phage vB_CsaM_GAP32]|uniref:Uncharacterized protein n=1 Tax=Cronobacter phage vB_CsaM_GAP32 TaxID=1141136 RepID=K4FAZ4_9CAUD|nr:virion structural protein [Cronobacter phage vB_CsaM_GAP32]AFC21449.1 hypothetical protein GAP32_002 [Cronobacter phage vB_CsaM_GAP32]